MPMNWLFEYHQMQDVGVLGFASSTKGRVPGLDLVTECPNVPSEILVPRNGWADKFASDATAKKLAGLFNKNFAEVKAAAPKA